MHVSHPSHCLHHPTSCTSTMLLCTRPFVRMRVLWMASSFVDRRRCIPPFKIGQVKVHGCCHRVIQNHHVFVRQDIILQAIGGVKIIVPPKVHHAEVGRQQRDEAVAISVHRNAVVIEAILRTRSVCGLEVDWLHVGMRAITIAVSAGITLIRTAHDVVGCKELAVQRRVIDRSWFRHIHRTDVDVPMLPQLAGHQRDLIVLDLLFAVSADMQQSLASFLVGEPSREHVRAAAVSYEGWSSVRLIAGSAVVAAVVGGAITIAAAVAINDFFRCCCNGERGGYNVRLPGCHRWRCIIRSLCRSDL
mmetsp:Transcript_12109/g.33340  ORF Transcript_12109/g.33340 Transcript_12109/m.33340 type:complete len:304 (+) Transcript_12109:647-1558(+)